MRELQKVPVGTTRSGRTRKAPKRLNLTAFESILEPYDYSD
jgi:hypothetical protein